MTGSNDEKKYRFKVLTETAEEEDLFEDKTHEKIANTLYDIINDPENSEGITIGLEGTWGSGKSTVINLLKKKYKESENQDQSDKAFFFYFDAWAHEGDSLRRIFLESFIAKLQLENEGQSAELSDIENKVSNKTKKITRKSSRGATRLGIWLAVAIFFVPIGIAITEIPDNEYSSLLDAFSIICSIAPLIVLILVWFLLFVKFKPNEKNSKRKRLKNRFKYAFQIDNWTFLEKDSIDTVETEVSEENDRSSIEFESFFYQLVSEYLFKKYSYSKLIIVADNLDRVDQNDSLKIWSTLQTFLQRKNPSDEDPEKNDFYKKIWIIVPYDRHGLRKLWSNDLNIPDPDELQKLTKGKEDIAKSFFDKSFQLRIAVPKSVITGWENFLKMNARKSLLNWKDEEIDEITAVLKHTRKDPTDVPTPREIKTYINQVGLFRIKFDSSEISNKPIAYYVVFKYLDFFSTKDIEKLLLTFRSTDRYPEKYKENAMLVYELSEIGDQIAAIMYGVGREKAMQLLLVPKIVEAIDNRDRGSLEEIEEAYKSAFWTAFDRLMSGRGSFETLSQICPSMENLLFESDGTEFKYFVRQIQKISEECKFSYPDSDFYYQNYKALFTILNYFDDNREILPENTKSDMIWDYYLSLFEEKIGKNSEVSISTELKHMESIWDCFDGRFHQRILNNTSPEKWGEIADINFELPYPDGYELIIRPGVETIKDFYNNVKGGQQLPENINSFANYCINSCFDAEYYDEETDYSDTDSLEEEYLDILLKNLLAYLQNLPEGDIEGLYPEDLYNVLLTVSNLESQNYKPQLTQICDQPNFIDEDIDNQVIIKKSALLTVRYCSPDKIYERPDLVLFWTEPDEENAKFVFEQSAKYTDNNFIWEFSKDDDFALIGEVIKLDLDQFENGKSTVFIKGGRDINDFRNSLNLLDHDDNLTDDLESKLTEAFLQNSDILNSIINDEDMNIDEYKHELYLISKLTNSSELFKNLKKNLPNVEEGVWDDEFQDDYPELLELCIHVSSHYPKKSGFMDSPYYEPLRMNLDKWLRDSAEPSDWLKDNVQNAIKALLPEFQKELGNSLADTLSELNYYYNDEAFTKLKDYINFFHSYSLKERIEDIVLSFINTDNFEMLNRIAEIFEIENLGNYNLKKPGTFKRELCTKISDNPEKEDLLEKIAFNFGVDCTYFEITEEGDEEQ